MRSVLFCSVLFCSVLFCSVLFCSVLFCSVLFCSVLFCSVLFCSVLFCSVLFCSVLFCSVLFCSVLFSFCSVPFRSVPFRSVPFRSRSVPFRSVPFCSVLFCSVLFCSVLVWFWSVLFCSVLVCSGLFWSVLFCSVLFCSVILCQVQFKSIHFGTAQLSSVRFTMLKKKSSSLVMIRASHPRCIGKRFSAPPRGVRRPHPQPSRRARNTTGRHILLPTWCVLVNPQRDYPKTRRRPSASANSFLCLHVVSDDLINSQVEVRRTRNTTARQIVDSASCVLVNAEHEYTEDTADEKTYLNRRWVKIRKITKSFPQKGRFCIAVFSRTQAARTDSGCVRMKRAAALCKNNPVRHSNKSHANDSAAPPLTSFQRIPYDSYQKQHSSATAAGALEDDTKRQA